MTSEDHTSEREETINPSDIIDGSEILNQMAGSEPDINEGSSRYSHGERYSSVQKYINALSMSRRLQTFTELVDNYNDKLNLLFSMEQPLNIYTNQYKGIDKSSSYTYISKSFISFNTNDLSNASSGLQMNTDTDLTQVPKSLNELICRGVHSFLTTSSNFPVIFFKNILM